VPVYANYHRIIGTLLKTTGAGPEQNNAWGRLHGDEKLGEHFFFA